MIKIKNRCYDEARFVSYEFARENIDAESKFFYTKNFKYELISVFSYSNRKMLIGGINGEKVGDIFYLDEIWVNSEHRNIWVGKRMLIYLSKYLKENNLSCEYYPHLEPFKDYFIKNSFDCNPKKY